MPDESWTCFNFFKTLVATEKMQWVVKNYAKDEKQTNENDVLYHRNVI